MSIGREGQKVDGLMECEEDGEGIWGQCESSGEKSEVEVNGALACFFVILSSNVSFWGVYF